VDVQAAPIHLEPETPGAVLVIIQPRSVAAAMNRSLATHGSARTLSGLAAMLAHEIKNPLSGISGAAQLLEMSLGDSEAEMLGLIQDEVDRIRALLDRMDAFGDAGPGERRAVNIHDVLNQARVSAAAGFARHIRFREFYDPSLPALPGDRARLLQALSNLLKNAAEAAPRKGGEIVLRTAFRPGVKMIVSGGGRESLPLEVSVIDNGPGVPESLEPHIFDPFVTVVCAPKPSEKIPRAEQAASAACVCAALVNASLAFGFGANWLTDWPAGDRPFLEEALGLAPEEELAGFIHIGTPRAAPPERPRPDAAALTQALDAAGPEAAFR
ncbi:MAG: histidine kinase dimerization/phospho-acceptor domain-containing protein, partial [Pseudomonadota bacterium]